MKLATALWAPLLLTLGACGSADTSGLYGGDPSGGGAAGTSESGGTHGSPRKGSGGGAPGGSGGAGAEPSSGGSGGAEPSSGGAGGGGAAPASGGAGPASGGAGGTPEVSCKDDKKCKPLICLKKLHICGPPGPAGMPCDRDEECISDSCEDDQCE